jgi:DNA-binding NarL/FixJ family response regulator
MQMPGMDGEQTARAIKSDPLVKDVKIVILTSMGKRGDAARLHALGCSGYLLKPVKQQMLYEALLAILSSIGNEEPDLVTRHVISEKLSVGKRILLAEDNSINQKPSQAYTMPFLWMCKCPNWMALRPHAKFAIGKAGGIITSPSSP